MRIISGKFKGRKLNPPLAKWKTRPTMDFSREALFNILENRFDLSSVKVLDLFGGTGSVSLEFVSRGSQHVAFVDKNAACVQFLAGEAKHMGIAEELILFREDVLRFLEKQVEPFDIIFCDPPYDYPNYEPIYKIIFEKRLIMNGGMLIFEHDKKKDFSYLPYFSQVRKYGTSLFSFFEFSGEVFSISEK